MALIAVFSLISNAVGQSPQGFFLDTWSPKVISSPGFTDIQQTTDPVTVAITVDFNDTITRVSKYLFGDNANLWTGCMSNNNDLMKNLAARHIGVLRGPGGSISDVFFWNRTVDQRPTDIPSTLVGSSDTNWPWYGKRPYAWETWTMAVDSFYSVLGKAGATGMITVNYGYARYGTGPYPVTNAAHMAADWVRYDKGRTKFWEIGNEVSGSWEAGNRINTSLNQDGQPEYLTPALYGQHCLVYIDSMKAAAAETGYDIRIGVVMAESSSASSTWNKAVAEVVGDKADFFIVHSYYTPYNQNSDVSTILNSYLSTDSYKSFVWGELDKAGKPHRPVALTEYNIFAVGSNQPVSHINGMHAVLVTGEAMKAGYGAALRWDLANGWSNGDDMGMFSYGDEPGIPTYSPRPAFYHLYYLQKFTGDVLLNSSMTGSSGVVIFPTAFSSGQVGAALVNTEKRQKVIRLNIKNFKFGDRYYYYTLTGNPSEDFSRKVFVNGTGNSLAAGGPDNYESINANSSAIDTEIKIKIPPLSAVYMLVEPGTKELVLNNEVVDAFKVHEDYTVNIFPNPSDGNFKVYGIPVWVRKTEIKDALGRDVYTNTGSYSGTSDTFSLSLKRGLYLITFSGNERRFTSKLIIK